MAFIPTKFDDKVNVSVTNYKKEFLKFSLVIAAIIVLIYFVFQIIFHVAIYRISPKTMNRIFSKISWIENLKNIPKEDLQSQRMNELLDQIPKKFIPNGYDIKILVKEDGKINAFAVPGGLIILTTSLIKAAKNDEELTFVIGHELGHFAHKDHLRTISRGLATKLTTSIILGSSEILLGISSGFLDLIDNKYSRNQELKADIWGLNIIMHQHGRADGALGFFETISQNKSEFNFQDFLATHPISQTRIKNIKDSNILTRH